MATRAKRCAPPDAASGSPGSAVLRFTVAGPPQPKERARRGKGGRWYTPERTRSYEARVRWLCAAAASRAGWARGPGAAYAVDLAMFFGDARRRDVDNATKAILDALNGVAWLDDSEVVELSVRRAIDRSTPRVEVEIRRIPDDGKPSSALKLIPNRAQVRETQRFTTGCQPVGPCFGADAYPGARAKVARAAISAAASARARCWPAPNGPRRAPLSALSLRLRAPPGNRVRSVPVRRGSSAPLLPRCRPVASRASVPSPQPPRRPRSARPGAE